MFISSEAYLAHIVGRWPVEVRSNVQCIKLSVGHIQAHVRERQQQKGEGHSEDACDNRNGIVYVVSTCRSGITGQTAAHLHSITKLVCDMILVFPSPLNTGIYGLQQKVEVPQV